MTASQAKDSRCDRHARLSLEHRRKRLEKRYRRLLALYPKDRRREQAADSADRIAGALRIRGRMALNRIRQARWFPATARDLRWSDALTVARRHRS